MCKIIAMFCRGKNILEIFLDFKNVMDNIMETNIKRKIKNLLPILTI